MRDRQVVLDRAELVDEQAEALRKATERAERAEAQLTKLKSQAAGSLTVQEKGGDETLAAETELRKDSMMAHLLDSLAEGKDVGHYGRLVFAMVARHFMDHEEVITWLTRDPDFSEEKARVMLRQVEVRDYNPPRRDRIVEWQRQQEFPILPHPDDPDCGNLYRNLKFPEGIYQHIEQYQEAKTEAEEDPTAAA